MKYTLIGIAALVLLAGCDTALGTKNFKVENTAVFFKHKGTGLCFVGLDTDGDNAFEGTYGFTNVPCTPEVEKLIADHAE